ncbi:MAG: efflux transporter outer membrane subunit [Opitutales bacterium]
MGYKRLNNCSILRGVSMIAIVGLLSSCQMYKPDEQKSESFEKSIPETFIDSSDEELVVDEKWWQEFGDEQLNEFIEEALQNSPSLGEIYARLNSAQAQVDISETQLFPSLDATASAQVGDSASNGVESYGLSFAASYELDLWGKVNASIQSSQANLMQAKMNTQTAVNTLISNIVIAWIQIQSEMRYREVLESQLKVNTETLESMYFRFSMGRSDNILDVLQQRQTTNTTRNAIPLSEQAECLYRSKLCILLGKPANTKLKIDLVKDIANPRDLPTSGIPTQIFEGRPDIKASKYALMSAMWTLASAKADRLPKIALSSAVPVLSFQSDRISSLFENWTIQIAGMISQPIFDAGLRNATVRQNQALALEAFNSYKSTVLSALAEVQDSITNESTQKRYITSLLKSYENAGDMLSESKNRYAKGLTDYLDVASSITTTQSLELNLITAKRDLILYRLSLYSTLGGAWITNISDKVEKEKNKIYENSNFAPIEAEVLGQYL